MTHSVVDITRLEEIAEHFESLASEVQKKQTKAKPVERKVLAREFITLKSCAAFVRCCHLEQPDDEISVLFLDNRAAHQWLMEKGFIYTKDGWAKNDSRAIIQFYDNGWLVTIYTTQVK